MDLLQQPDVKNVYVKCKYKVKYWEHQFKKNHGRLPSKLDIKEADREIRNAYKTYYNLKSATLEQSFQDIEGFESDEETPIPNVSTTNTSDDLETSNQKTDESAIIPSSLETSANDSPSLEKSHMTDEMGGDIKNNSNAWGSHLNNQNEVTDKVAKGEILNVNSSFSQKLYKNASFSKRNPRKSLSFHHRKSETNLNISKSLSQPSPSTIAEPDASFENIDMTIDILKSDTLRISSNFQPAQTKSLNIVQSVLDNNFKSSRNVDSGWMERVAITTGTKMKNKEINVENFGLSQQFNSQDTTVDYDSEDIVADSDEEEEMRLHLAKKRKIDTPQVNQKLDFSNVFKSNTSENESNIGNSAVATVATNNNSSNVNNAVFGNSPVIKTVLGNNSFVANSTEVTNVFGNNLNHENSLLVANNVSSEMDSTKMDTDETAELVVKPKRVTKKNTKVVEKENNKSVRKSTRRKTTIKQLEVNSDPEDPFGNEEENDPEYNPDPKKSEDYHFDGSDEEKVENKPKSTVKTPKPKKPPKVAKSKKQEETKEEVAEDPSAPYELEFSVKPRFVTVPRDPNLKNVLKKARTVKVAKKPKGELKDDQTGSVVKNKKQQEMEKFEKKVASGNLNENFVRVNLKKKMFTRGKKGLNFSKYKKQMWKQKKKNNSLAGPEMDMGGCDGGMLTCFNCGQTGHFAQNCKATDGDKLLPISAADQEYCPFPTLEEASQMAQESHLVVRKPKSGLSNEDEGADQTSDSSDNDEEICPNSQEEDMFSDDDDDELLAETLKLEEYVSKIDMKQYIDSTRVIKPYYNLNEDGSLIDTPQEVYDVLKLFGFDSFRPGQERAIMRILSGQSTLVTLSTGSGKSFCYQLPAYLYARREPCIALIISPLVSLMEDQVIGIPSFLKAACLHTNKTKVQKEKILEAISSGELDVLLVSPEAVVAGEKSAGFGSLLRKLPPVAFACIDEAHCVSQWSHNFRPSYLMICRILKERLGVHTILGLTATATRATSDSIIDHLAIPDGRNGIITDTPLPDNLRLTVSKDAQRDHALLGLLLSERFENLKSVIVYCTRRQECERIASFLRTSLKSEKPTVESNNKKRKKLNVQAEPYHAGLSASSRRTIQRRFMSGDLRIVVATVAFGMGINKSDIRAVIHYNLPKNFESYVQEVGRAGRDGIPAHCHLFLDSRGRDENELQRHVFSDSIDRHVIRKLIQKIFVPCSCKNVCPRHEVAFSIQETVTLLDIPEENISTLLCYLELHNERYIEVLSPAYINCKIIVYGGALLIRKAAKECPPLAMALAMYGDKDANENTFEFPVVEVASAMGWDSGICKHKLKNLEWETENNQPKRSLITVQFTNLGFRLLAPGNLTGEQLDDTLDTLQKRVVDQEKTSLLQLHALHDTVTSVAAPSHRGCVSEEVTDKEIKLKKCIREYFESPNPLLMVDITEKKCDEGLIANDVRAIINMYRDNQFTGRAIARIFYGIPSPNYPPVVWGRCKFWRAHMDNDFNAILRIATQEILRMRL